VGETLELETSLVVDAAGLLDVELRVEDTGAVEMRVEETGMLKPSVLLDATCLLEVDPLDKTTRVLVEMVGLLETSAVVEVASLVVETVGFLDTCALLEALGLTDVVLLVVGLDLIGESVV
jgi:hypothetical protein